MRTELSRTFQICCWIISTWSACYRTDDIHDWQHGHTKYNKVFRDPICPTLCWESSSNITSIWLRPLEKASADLYIVAQQYSVDYKNVCCKNVYTTYNNAHVYQRVWSKNNKTGCATFPIFCKLPICIAKR